MSRPFVLRTYADRLHAELARSVLESEGIEAFVSASEGMAGGYVSSYMGEAVTPHELQVPEELAAEAEAILKETEDGEWEVDDNGEPVGSDAYQESETQPSDSAPVDRVEELFTVHKRKLFLLVVILIALVYPARSLPAPMPVLYELFVVIAIVLVFFFLRCYGIRILSRANDHPPRNH